MGTSYLIPKNSLTSNRFLMALVCLVSSAMALTACDDNSTVSVGPAVNAGPVSVSLKATSNLDIVLESSASIPLVGNDNLGLTLDVAYERTLFTMRQQPATSGYWLYVLWDLGDGVIRRKTYNSQTSFDIRFREEEWVERITTENGNVVVYVRFRDLAGQSASPNVPDAPNVNCQPQFPARLNVGGQASIVVYQVRVFTEPSSNASLVPRQYFARHRLLEVQQGPVCRENRNWWYVYSQDLGYGGWVPEADHENYFMSPR